MSGTCLPSVNDFIDDEIIQKQVSISKNQNGVISARININSCCSASLKLKDEKGNYKEDYYSRYY
ncbi:Uncharacterised protein [Moraxella ovis]|nr:hypothetical protein [Moraxella ovis]STY98551.1 Uncharacterised protein [Moraxella ovis]